MPTPPAQNPALNEATDEESLAPLLPTLLEGSRPAVEARLEILSRWSKSPAIAAWACETLRAFPFDSWRIAVAARCIGLALLHGEGPLALGLEVERKLPGPAAAFRAAALRAAERFARRVAEGPLPAVDLANLSLSAASGRALHQDFLRLASACRSDTVPQLARTLGVGPATQITERVVALYDFPRDPRIAEAIAGIFASPDVGRKIETPLFLALGLGFVLHADEPQRARLGAMLTGLPALAWLELLRAPPEVAAAPIAERPQAELRDEQAFLGWLAEAPADLARRSVFADWLLEQGDPRGELYAIQLRGVDAPLSAKEARRAAALIRKHGRAWLRPLGPAVSTLREPVFERGALLGLALDTTRRLPAPDHPLLATVERLELLGTGGAAAALAELLQQGHDRVATFLAEAPFPLLRELDATIEVLSRVPARHLARIEVLATSIEYAHQLERLQALPPLTRCTSLAFAFFRPEPRALVTLPCFATIERLHVARPPQMVDHWLEALAGSRVRQLSVGWAASCLLHIDRVANTLRVEVGDHDPDVARHFAEVFQRLPRELRAGATCSYHPKSKVKPGAIEALLRKP